MRRGNAIKIERYRYKKRNGRRAFYYIASVRCDCGEVLVSERRRSSAHAKEELSALLAKHLEYHHDLTSAVLRVATATA